MFASKRANNLSFTLFLSAGLTTEETEVSRQSYAGLLWSKQFYHYIIHDWLIGDPEMPAPPEERLSGRNSEAEWRQLFNRDVVSMPDKWEYPWVGFEHTPPVTFQAKIQENALIFSLQN